MPIWLGNKGLLCMRDYYVIIGKLEIKIQKGLPEIYHKADPNLKELTKDELNNLFFECDSIRASLIQEMSERK